MKKLIAALLLCIFWSGAILSAQVFQPTTVSVQEEAITQGRVRTINFVGGALTAVVVGDVATVTDIGLSVAIGTVQDEGVPLLQRSVINFIGTSIACADDLLNLRTNCTVSAGSGSANTVEVSMNLGTTGAQVFTSTVTGQAWVTASSVIVCSPFATSADGQTVETYAAAAFTPQAATRVAGTGFDLWVDSPRGATGTFRFHCTGA